MVRLSSPMRRGGSEVGARTRAGELMRTVAGGVRVGKGGFGKIQYTVG